jgi:hypothetical protein
MIPPVLEGDHRVRLIRTEHRGHTQYQADRRIGGYWLVMDTARRLHMPSDGETWEVRVMRTINSTAFCHLGRKLRNADGLHPFVSATKSYVERKCAVSVHIRGQQTYRDRKPIAAVDVITGGRIRLTFVDGGSFTLSDYPTLKDAPYGRQSFHDFADGREIYGTFWEN